PVRVARACSFAVRFWPSPTRTAPSAVRDIAAIVASEEVGELIVGEPRNLDGSRGPAGERWRPFADRLRTATGLPVAMTDEALTTVEAAARLRAAGVDPRRHPERL